MAMLPSQFKADDHETMEDFTPIPEGWQNALVFESEMALTKKAKEENDPSIGQMLVLKFKIMDGKYKDRQVYVRLNIVNKNAQAVEIANKELATICKAVGLVAVQDSAELHGKPMRLKLAVQEGSNGYGPSNTVKNYKEYDGPIDEADAPQQEAAASTGESKPKKKIW